MRWLIQNNNGKTNIVFIMPTLKPNYAIMLFKRTAKRSKTYGGIAICCGASLHALGLRFGVFFAFTGVCLIAVCFTVLAIAGVLAIIPIKASAVINLVLNFMRFPP